MKKEVIIAIVLGFGLGLIITFGIWTANRALGDKKDATPTPAVITPSPAITPSPTPAALELEINQPEDNFLTDQENITISGKTQPEAIIVILYGDGETILEANQEGTFETKISLVGGANEIIIRALDENGNQAESVLNVVYSTSQI